MEKSKRKLLFLITKSNWGGAQRYVHDLATHLPQDQFEIKVAVGGNGDLVQKLKTAGVAVITLPSLQRDLSFTKELNSLQKLYGLIQSEAPDILHINSSKAGIFGALIGRLTGVPRVIFTAHGWAFNEDRPWWQRFIIKTIHWLTVLLSHQTIAVSHEVRRQMNWPLAAKKIEVIHNGRTIKDFQNRTKARDHFCAIEPKLRLYQNDFWSITVAELHPIKRHDAVIETIAQVVQKAPDHRHLIIGGGEKQRELEALVKELKLEDHVFLLGSVTEAAEYLKAADLFILASRSEAMAYVIIEAATAGLPIVATRVGGVPEILEHQVSGLLTPPFDNKSLFEAILSIRQDSVLKERLATQAKDRAQEFTLEKTLAHTLKVYRH